MGLFGNLLYCYKMLWLRTLTLLMVFSIPVFCCIKCSKEAQNKFEDLRNNILADNMGIKEYNVQEFRRFKEYATAAYEETMKPFRNKHIDKYGLGQMYMEMKKVNDRIEMSNAKGTSLINEIAFNFKRLGKELKRIVDQFEENRSCPNLRQQHPCGRMNQSVIQCNDCKETERACLPGVPACKYMILNCPPFSVDCKCNQDKDKEEICKPIGCEKCMHAPQCLENALNCGDRNIELIEAEDMYLDCSLFWHAKMEDRITYKFYNTTEGMSNLLVMSEDYKFIKRGVTMQDAGSYKCIAEVINKYIISILRFHVKVLKSEVEGKTFEARPTLSSLPELQSHHTKQKLINQRTEIIIIITSGGILILLIVSVSIYIILNKKKHMAEASSRKEQQDKDMLEMTY